jgi:flagellar biogenesis protein FliO
MSAEKYRLYAREAFLIADNVTDPGTRAWLIEVAQSWLVLAEQAEKNPAANLVHETPPSPNEANDSVTQQQQQIQPEKKDE